MTKLKMWLARLLYTTSVVQESF